MSSVVTDAGMFNSLCKSIFLCTIIFFCLKFSTSAHTVYAGNESFNVACLKKRFSPHSLIKYTWLGIEFFYPFHFST